MKLTTKLAAYSCATALLCGGGIPAWAGDLAQVVSADERVAPVGEKTVINQGHVDIGPLLTDGTAELLARDDSAATPTWRHGADIVFRLSDAAKQTLPPGNQFSFVGAAGGESVWVVPQTEVAGVPWMGWSTQSPSLIAAADRGIRLSFLGHQGPGEFSLFLQNGGFEAPQLLWSTVKPGEKDLWVDLHTHTHANWTFTKPGVHLVGLRATIPLQRGGEKTTDIHLAFAVGDVTSVADAQAATWNPAAENHAGSGSGGFGSLLWLLLGGGSAVLVVGVLAVVAVRRGR